MCLSSTDPTIFFSFLKGGMGWEGGMSLSFIYSLFPPRIFHCTPTSAMRQERVNKSAITLTQVMHCIFAVIVRRRLQYGYHCTPNNRTQYWTAPTQIDRSFLQRDSINRHKAVLQVLHYFIGSPPPLSSISSSRVQQQAEGCKCNWAADSSMKQQWAEAIQLLFRVFELNEVFWCLVGCFFFRLVCSVKACFEPGEPLRITMSALFWLLLLFLF